MRNRRLPFVLSRPEQGWSSVVLLLSMLVLLGVSVANSRPLELDSGSLSSSLPVIMLAAGLIGFLLARSALGVVRAHLIGAFIAAAVLLFVAGAALLEGQSPLPTSLDGIGLRVSAVWTQLDADIARLISEEITTSTVTVFLVLGALCWTTAQFGAFSIFRYDRGGPAVMAVGTVLFLNVGLGSLRAEEELLPVIPVLALFAALALLLLMRLQLVQQRFAWARRHISDTRDVSRLFLRTGTVFVLIAVLSASSLTAWATIDAQEVDIGALEDPLEDVVEQLDWLLGIIGAPPPDQVPPSLGGSTSLKSDWTPGQGNAFTAIVDGGLYGNYWWGKAEDLYDPEAQTWSATDTRQVEVGAGRQLTPADGGEAGGEFRVSGTQIELGGTARANLFRPPDVLLIRDQAVEARVAVDGSVSDLEYLEPLDRDAEVAFQSFVRDYRPLNDSITGNQLRATAGQRYPDWILTYLSGADDPRIIGQFTEERIAKVRAEADGETPYDLAVAVQRELRSMTYDDTLGDLCEPYTAFTECLLAEERGFCQQYATTMVMMMRAMGVPARFVTGYLQGEEVSGGQWVVPQRALHNWVEVYFPGRGWVRFDPTPGLEGLGQVPTALDDGPPIGPGPSPTPEPEPSEDPFDDDEIEEPFVPPIEEPPAPADGGGSSAGIFISLGALAGILVALVSGLLLYRLRRLPEGDDSLAYLGIVSLATRLGYGPHPSQTEYEYASTLSETIPGVRHDLYVVTDAQVETTYGEQELEEERRTRLRAAYARIRTALLRLSLRWRR